MHNGHLASQIFTFLSTDAPLGAAPVIALERTADRYCYPDFHALLTQVIFFDALMKPGGDQHIARDIRVNQIR